MDKNRGDNEEYNVIELPGKHGRILLHVPKREAKQEEIDALHKTVAQVIYKSSYARGIID